MSRFVDLTDDIGRRLMLNRDHILGVVIHRGDQFTMRLEISMVGGRDTINWTGRPELAVEILEMIQHGEARR